MPPKQSTETKQAYSSQLRNVPFTNTVGWPPLGGGYNETHIGSETLSPHLSRKPSFIVRNKPLPDSTSSDMTHMGYDAKPEILVLGGMSSTR